MCHQECDRSDFPWIGNWRITVLRQLMVVERSRWASDLDRVSEIGFPESIQSPDLSGSQSRRC